MQQQPAAAASIVQINTQPAQIFLRSRATTANNGRLMMSTFARRSLSQQFNTPIIFNRAGVSRRRHTETNVCYQLNRNASARPTHIIHTWGTNDRSVMWKHFRASHPLCPFPPAWRTRCSSFQVVLEPPQRTNLGARAHTRVQLLCTHTHTHEFMLFLLPTIAPQGNSGHARILFAQNCVRTIVTSASFIVSDLDAACYVLFNKFRVNFIFILVSVELYVLRSMIFYHVIVFEKWLESRSAKPEPVSNS